MRRGPGPIQKKLQVVGPLTLGEPESCMSKVIPELVVNLGVVQDGVYQMGIVKRRLYKRGVVQRGL